MNISSLPQEILSHTFSFTSFKDKIRFQRVCKQWCSIILNFPEPKLSQYLSLSKGRLSSPAMSEQMQNLTSISQLGRSVFKLSFLDKKAQLFFLKEESKYVEYDYINADADFYFISRSEESEIQVQNLVVIEQQSHKEVANLKVITKKISACFSHLKNQIILQTWEKKVEIWSLKNTPPTLIKSLSDLPLFVRKVDSLVLGLRGFFNSYNYSWTETPLPFITFSHFLSNGEAFIFLRSTDIHYYEVHNNELKEQWCVDASKFLKDPDGSIDGLLPIELSQQYLLLSLNELYCNESAEHTCNRCFWVLDRAGHLVLRLPDNSGGDAIWACLANDFIIQATSHTTLEIWFILDQKCIRKVSLDHIDPKDQMLWKIFFRNHLLVLAVKQDKKTHLIQFDLTLDLSH